MIWNDLRDWSEMEYFKEIEKTGDRLLKDFAVGTKLGTFSRRAGKSVLFTQYICKKHTLQQKSET